MKHHRNKFFVVFAVFMVIVFLWWVWPVKEVTKPSLETPTEALTVP